MRKFPASTFSPSPLYVGQITKILREMASTSRKGFDYIEFKRRLQGSKLSRAQQGPLQQRLELLDSFLIITSKWQQGWSDWRPNFSTEELREVCYRTMLRIQIVCGGMLEVTDHHEVVKPGTDLDDPMKFPFRGRRVCFFHRTVHDFLVDNPAGQAILGCSTITENDLFHAMIEADLFVQTRRIYQLSWEDIGELITTIDDFHGFNSYVSDNETVANLNQVKQYLPQIAHAALAQQFDLPHEINHSFTESDRSCEYQLATYSMERVDTVYSLAGNDFMGLSLRVGVSTYLENFLRTYSHTQLQMPKIHKQYKDYLLTCACHGYASRLVSHERLRPFEQAIVQLLNIGADPNAKLFLHPSLPNVSNPGSTLLNVQTQRMMTTDFCELFRHFLEKGFRLDDLDVFHFTALSGCQSIVDQIYTFLSETPGLIFRATRRRQLVNNWDAMVQICPELTSFESRKGEPDKPDMDVILVQSWYAELDHRLRAVLILSDGCHCVLANPATHMLLACVLLAY